MITERLKKLLPTIILALLFATYTVINNNPNEITQMVVMLPELNSKDLQRDLETDINNLPGVQFLETSLLSKTIMLNYDSRKVSPSDVENIFLKWGCQSSTYTHRKIPSLN